MICIYFDASLNSSIPIELLQVKKVVTTCVRTSEILN